MINQTAFDTLAALIETRRPELMHQLRGNSNHDFVTLARFLTRYFPIPVGWNRSEIMEATTLFETFYPVKREPTPAPPPPLPDVRPDLSVALDALARTILNKNPEVPVSVDDWAKDYLAGKFNRDFALDGITVPEAETDPDIEIATETQL